ncbi:hypothetical protein HMPREF9069_00390 [Atopobium sp. oral taxon 810 str. F0209]|nr:hypothetical protein HMPREF9069_00390 [Atopobium sp. oral taxon 810 str. F0209]
MQSPIQNYIKQRPDKKKPYVQGLYRIFRETLPAAEEKIFSSQRPKNFTLARTYKIRLSLTRPY